MNWTVLLPIIAQEGLPIAQALFHKWQAGLEPTAADFAELRLLGNQRAIDRVKARLLANGISLDSPKAVEILAMVD